MDTLPASQDAIALRLRELAANMTDAGKIPAYRLIARIISLAIDDGLWKPGDIIPPERFFIQEFGASSGTVKRAMLDLVNSGLLYRRRGSGTYVAESGFSRKFRRYYLFLEDFNSPESENRITLVSKKVIDPDPRICQLLDVPPSSSLIELTRSYEENGEAIACTRSYYEEARFRHLMDILPARYERIPLFLIIEEDFKIRAENSQELFCVTELFGEEARGLNVFPGYHALTIKSLTFDSRRHPFEYRICHAKSGYKSLFRSIQY
ncbi:MAG: GntR family transcriptional regulator [Mailhella sp.]|nr:GntR family transcriptional regulator [Mailhella sp.]